MRKLQVCHEIAEPVDVDYLACHRTICVCYRTHKVKRNYIGDRRAKIVYRNAHRHICRSGSKDVAAMKGVTNVFSEVYWIRDLKCTHRGIINDHKREQSIIRCNEHTIMRLGGDRPSNGADTRVDDADEYSPGRKIPKT